MLERNQRDERWDMRVALCYLSAAIEHLESEQGFSLPKSRRLSTNWLRWLRAADRRSSAAAQRTQQPAGPAAATNGAHELPPPSTAELVVAATDLLVSAFRESCSKAVLKDASRDAALDCVVALALERAHETCAAVDALARKGEHHAFEHRPG